MPILYLRVIFLAISFSAESAFSSLFSTVISESDSMDSKLRSNSMSALFIAFGAGAITVNTLAFWNKDANYLIYSSLAMAVVAVIPLYFYIIETPRFLFRKGYISEMVLSLNRISKINEHQNIDFYHKLIRDK